MTFTLPGRTESSPLRRRVEGFDSLFVSRREVTTGVDWLPMPADLCGFFAQGREILLPDHPSF